jgi:DNA processing protein
LNTSNILYYIALSKIPFVGGHVARNLISYCGGIKEVFDTKSHRVLKTPGVGTKIVESIQKHKATALGLAERELVLLEKNNIRCIPYNHIEYPQRMLFCQDAPLYIFIKGSTNLNAAKVLSFVGTRQASDYGKEMTEMIISELAPYNVLIVSGLAYGIDIAAHKAALKYGLPTVCVLAHGLSKIYPQANAVVANKMLNEGGAWVSEYTFDMDAERQNFPSRNRIVAGMADATVVIESAIKGGSLITAEIALSYQRDVFAIPGRTHDTRSQGCNYLIHQQKATLCSSAKDIINTMGWGEANEVKSNKLIKDYSHLDEQEQFLVGIIKDNSNIIQIDTLIEKSGKDRSIVLSTLLGLELKGILKTQKGSCFELI